MPLLARLFGGRRCLALLQLCLSRPYSCIALGTFARIHVGCASVDVSEQTAVVCLATARHCAIHWECLCIVTQRAQTVRCRCCCSSGVAPQPYRPRCHLSLRYRILSTIFCTRRLRLLIRLLRSRRSDPLQTSSGFELPIPCLLA